MEDKSENPSWEWTEPSNEEFEEKRKTANFYRLYTILDGKTVNLYKFWGENDDYAKQVLDLYKKTHSDTEDVFYGTSGYVVDPDGTRWDSLSESLARNDKENVFKKISGFFKYSVFRKLGDFWFDVKDAFRRAFTRHSIEESWSLYDHILSDMKYNLKKMAEHHMGCPTFICDRARERLGKERPMDGDYDGETMALAEKMWYDELMNLREAVLAYDYYRSYGIVDENDEDMDDIVEKYKDTLPYKPGTNKVFDYEKLNELALGKWNYIWNWMKEYGESLWD
jgi:hypothetical protein